MSSTIKNKDVVFEQELPDLEEAKRRVKVSNAGEHANDGLLEGCPHLRTMLPCKLSLEFVEGTKGIFIKNPIHALHLQSQFDRNESIQDWLLYGDEHEKSIAMQTAGYSETWHPEINNDYSTAPETILEKERNPHAGEKVNPDKKKVNPDKKKVDEKAKPLGASSHQESKPLGAGTPKIATGLTSMNSTTAAAPPSTDEALTVSAPKEDAKVPAAPSYLLSDEKFRAYAAEEQRIQSLFATTSSTSSLHNNRRTSNKRPKLLAPSVSRCTVNKQDYIREQRLVGAQLLCYLEHYRQSRNRYWKRVKAKHKPPPVVFGAFAEERTRVNDLSCQMNCCQREGDEDNLLQCLECSHVGCLGDESHSFEHWLTSGHNYATSCGPQANVYCFRCCSFVSHIVFAEERDRVDLECHLPWLAWKEHPVQRSFDAFWFSQLSYWKGMRATYPLPVPDHHVQAARLFRKRQLILQEKGPEAFQPPSPVGMYNLGNTCFMSSILQVMMNCLPLQKFFLTELQHDNSACLLCRRRRKSKADDTGAFSGVPSRLLPKKKKTRVCLACELDKVFLQYAASATGIYALTGQPVNRGAPLITTDILTSAWKCGGMNHLAGYEQRDAHEFLHALLEIVGQHIRHFRSSISDTLGSYAYQTRKSSEIDEIVNIFGGVLRSVLVCQDCGNKRSQSEPFFSLSLPLSKEVQVARQKMNVERCLKHFTLPETLADPVGCPACAKKTVTTKQHVISKLPKVLCLHLKRFDAAHNRKIEDYVAFPTTGLNMGHYLPHWAEVTLAHSEEPDPSLDLEPQVLYDLFSTVNHYGNLQSGHYITNAKVGDKWYHVNDSHVGFATEEAVQKSDGAYLLFYLRRS